MESCSMFIEDHLGAKVNIRRHGLILKAPSEASPGVLGVYLRIEGSYEGIN
jgi:hypothetical protein